MQCQLKLSLKDDWIRELQQDLTKKNLQYELSEVALQLGTVIENQSEKSHKLVSLVSDLLLNNVNESKHWNDYTKSLFAIILDYGGPALLKIIKERTGGRSLHTTYALVRIKVPTPTKLEEAVFAKVASFYNRIGYKGPFILAIDATAVLPSLQVSGNQIEGVATDKDSSVHTAHDITDLTNNANSEKACRSNPCSKTCA